MTPCWNVTKVFQFSASCPKEPKLKALSPLRRMSSVSDFVGASRIHTSGMTKNSVKNAISSTTKIRLSQRAGANAESGLVAALDLVPTVVLVAFKESPPEDKVCREPHGY